MATAPTYPGVYIEEISSGVHTITGVATSITAFVGFAPRGPVNDPTLVQSFSEFTRVFGGLSAQSTMSYAVNQFFLNGGRDALILRTAHLTGAGTKATKGTVDVGGTGTQKLSLEAASEGAWSGNLLVRVDQETSDKDAGSPKLFNLSIKDTATGTIEVLRNLPPDTLGRSVDRAAVQPGARDGDADGEAGRRRDDRSRRRPVRSRAYRPLPRYVARRGRHPDRPGSRTCHRRRDGGLRAGSGGSVQPPLHSAVPAFEQLRWRASPGVGREGSRGEVLLRPPRALPRGPASRLDRAVADHRRRRHEARHVRHRHLVRRPEERRHLLPILPRGRPRGGRRRRRLPAVRRRRRGDGADGRGARRVEGAGRSRRRALRRAAS